MKFMNNKDLYIIRENSGFVVSELVIGSGEQDINFEVQYLYLNKHWGIAWQHDQHHHGLVLPGKLL